MNGVSVNGGAALLLLLLGCPGVATLAAVVVDGRTGRGYGLGALSTLHLACTIFVVGAVAIAAQALPQPASSHTYGVTTWLVIYFIPSAYVILAIVIGAMIVAGIAHDWFWITGFVVAVVAPFLVATLPYSIWNLQTDYLVRQVGYLGVLLLPEAAVLAYSVTRLAHPVAPALARPPAPLN